VEDTRERHNFPIDPLLKGYFHKIYGDTELHRGCFGNLAVALKEWNMEYGVDEDRILVALDCFMNIPIDAKTGELKS
jgi:uncharacterized protein YcgI (DUF1989 family)